jgi:hypothetical protein
MPCAAGILGARPRRCPQCQAGAREGAGAGRQAGEMTSPSERHGNRMNETPPGEPGGNILGGANAERRRVTPHGRLSAGPRRAARRLSHLRPGPLRNMGSLAPRQLSIRTARPGAVVRIRGLATRTHRLRPLARSIHHLCRPQAPGTGNDRAHRNPIPFAGGAHRGPKRLSLSEHRDAEWARDKPAQR